MLKKSLSILLSAVMLLSVTVVYATVTEDTVTDTYTYTDDFSQYSTDKTSGYGSYGVSSGYTSDVFVGSGYCGFSIDVDGSYDGTAAIQFTQNKNIDDVKLQTRTLDISAAEKPTVTLSYDFKIVTNAVDETKNILLYSNTNSNTSLFKLGLEDGEWKFKAGVYSSESYAATAEPASYTYTLGHWYRLDVVSNYSGATTGTITDLTTNSVVIKSKMNYNIMKSFYALAIARNTDNGCSIMVDNVVLKTYDAAKIPPVVTTVPEISGQTKIEPNTSSVEVTFDQEIEINSSVATLTLEGAETEICTITPVANTEYTYCISWTAPLAANKPYTLDLSGIKNSAGIAAGSTAVYTFTTSSAAPVVISSTPADEATNISAETKALSITFDQFIATYPDSLTIADGVNAEVTTEDNITFTLNLTADLKGSTTYSVSLAEFKNADGKAPSKEAISFTTEFTGIVTETDGFENESWKTNWDARYDSGVLYHSNGGTWSGTHFSHADGYGGGKALSIHDDSEIFTALKTIRTNNTYTLEEGEVLVATWRINLKKMATVDAESNKAGSDIYVGGAISSETANYTNGGYAVGRIKTMNGKPYIYHEYDGLTNYAYLEENHWYNVYNVIEAESQTLYLVDAEGENKGSLVWKRSKKGETKLPNLMQKAAYVCVTDAGRRQDSSGNIYNDSQSFLLDDFTLYRINSQSRHHALEAAVEGSNGTYSMSFNQPVIGNETAVKVAEVLDSSEYNYNTDAKAQVLYPDFCTQSVSLFDTAYMTTYVLDYSALKGAAGTALKAGTNSVTAPFTTGLDTVRTLTLAGNASYENSLLTFKLYNDASLDETPKVYVALYKNDVFLGAVMPDEVITVSAKSDTTVSVSTDNYSGFDTIKVFAISGDYVPLMGVYNKLIK